MSNASKRANAQSMPIDRRTALAALAGASAFALPTAALASTPSAVILAAIARHRAARESFVAACQRADDVAAVGEGREVTAADLAAHKDAEAAEAEAREAVLASPMAAPADLRALADWADEMALADDPAFVGRLLDALRVSPLLAG